MKKKLNEILIYLGIVFVVANGVSYYRSLSLNKDNLQLSTVNLIDGSHYEIPKDKPLMVHFWATWCGTCKFESGNIQRLAEKYEVLTIAVNSGSIEEVQNFLKSRELGFRVVNDANGSLSKTFNVSAFPTTLIYNKDKELKFTDVGYTTTAGLMARMAFVD